MFDMFNATSKRLRCLFLPLLTLCALPAAAQEEPQAVILQYHHVATDTPPVTSIGLDGLREHLEFLRDQDFSVLPLEEVIAALQGDQTLPPRTAVITFDDGYLSVYDQAYPLLRELDFPFTIFVTAGLVSSNSALYASWEQLREMGDNGATLANHSVSHPYLLDRRPEETRDQWLARVREEIVEAERIIESETGQSHRLFAYPYGEYDPAIQSLVRELDFIGIGQHSGPVNAWSDFSALPRFPLSGVYASMNTFPVKMRSRALHVKLASPDSPVTMQSSPEAVLEFGAPYRFDAMNCFNNNEAMTIEELDESDRVFRITTPVSNSSRRFRYNCTIPADGGDYYWYSVPWTNPAVSE